MKKSYTIAGIGVCLGAKPGCEILAETLIAASHVSGKELENSLNLAVQEALQYTAQKNLPIITDTKTSEPGAQTLCADFREMLKVAPENALLLSHRENGWLAVALTQEDTGFARVEITDDGKDENGDAFWELVLSAMEIRFTLHLDQRDSNYRFWDSMEPREKEIHFRGIRVHLTEPDIPVSKVHVGQKYLLPVIFTTVEEAKQKLVVLKKTVSLKTAMNELLLDLANRTGTTNTIVLLADSFRGLDEDIDDLLGQADHLLDVGFVWRRPSGSRYIRRSCENPQIVFMNPPANMFNARAFYHFFLSFYGAMREIHHSKTNKVLTGDKNIFFSDYMFDLVVTHLTSTLLEGIGIKPQVLSGASMGEMANILRYLEHSDGTPAEIEGTLMKIREPLAFMMRSDDGPLNDYLGRKTDGFTKFYVKGDAKAICQAAEKYEGVFVMIIGSTEDVILTGERSALRQLMEEVGGVANELYGANYIHTPVAAHLADSIRQGLMESDLRLAPLDYTVFSTQFLKPMDNTVEMFAENTARLVTQTIDYASAVEELYARGGRVFIDLSTTQLCGTWASATLKDKPDAVVASIYSAGETTEMLLSLCAELIAFNVPFEFQMMLSHLSFREGPVREITSMDKEVAPMDKMMSPMTEPTKTAMTGDEFAQVLQRQILNNETAFKMFMDAQNKLYEQMIGNSAPAAQSSDAKKASVKFPNASKTYLYDREQVITMTESSMAAVLGDQYKEVDQYPVRARMPLPPFLFVSRIISIDAEYGVFRPSSIVTEFDLDEDCVFRTGETHICPLIASEASHIAIFLIAYMGLDAISKGTLSYRAIDSSMTACSERPYRVGDTLRTVLKINRFVKNGSTTLLFFTFESYNGDELISITEATGGFFTSADLSSTKGIIRPKIQMKKNVEIKEFPHIPYAVRTTYEKDEMLAFFRGDYEGCFGVKPEFGKKETYRLPHDMIMVDRVTNIDYTGGVHGRGLICGEKQITPDMWPFKVHFKNDPVFPAIITSDGVTQLGMFLFAHTGLLGRFKNASFTTLKGNRCNSKFRGQVRQGYSLLRYEVSVKDVVIHDDNICVYLDAAIFNDEVQIMQIDSYTMKIVETGD